VERRRGEREIEREREGERERGKDVIFLSPADCLILSAAKYNRY
jgi:hypothetical protein